MIIEYPKIGKVIPHVFDVNEHLLEGIDPDSDNYKKTVFDLEQLQYSFNSLSHSYFSFLSALETIVIDQLSITENKKGFVGIEGNKREMLGFHIDSFLESARRTQNSIIPYLSKSEKVSLPSSLSDVSKKLRNGKLAISEKIDRAILDYWDKNGSRLKDYRDLSQHHAAISPDAMAFFSNDGRPVVQLTLPNNPEVKSISKLLFDNPKVHAAAYIRKEFLSLIEFIYKTIKLIHIPPENPDIKIMRHVYKKTIKFGPGAVHDGTFLVSNDLSKNEIDHFVKLLEKEYA